MSTTQLGYIERPSTNLDATYSARGIHYSLGDVNGDGLADLLVLGADYPSDVVSAVNFRPQPARLFLGTSDGGFQPAPSPLFPVDSILTVNPSDVVYADFNKDGRNDVFIANHGWNAAPYPGEQNILLLSTANGGWRNATSELPQISDFTRTASAGDIDGDGDLDLFVGNGDRNTGASGQPPYLLLNDGTGRFVRDDARLPTGAGEALDLHRADGKVPKFAGSQLADLDADGKPDLIVTADASAANNSFRQTTVFWNVDGRFSTAHSTVLPHPTGLPSHIDVDVGVADFDRDGFRDVVLVGTNGDPAYDGGFVQLFRGQGQRRFVEQTQEILPRADQISAQDGAARGAPAPVRVRIGDFNSDAAPDFWMEYGGTPGADTPMLWLNNGFGQFNVYRASAFVTPGDEVQLAGAQFYRTSQGQQAISLQSFIGSGGLLMTGRTTQTPLYGYPGNQLPLAASLEATILEDQSVDGRLPIATDRDGDGVRYFKLSDPTGGAVFNVQPDGRFSYFPAADQFGTQKVQWGVTDGRGSSYVYTLTVNVTAVVDLIVGGEGPDVRIGFDDADVIRGLGGDDQLSGLGGDDLLEGGDGNDQLEGGLGHDTLRGESGLDRLFGGSGTDELLGGADDDQLDGGEGDDALFGDAGNDLLIGGAGNDALVGGKGADQLDGGSGNDLYRYAVGDGADRILAASGIDQGHLDALELGAGIQAADLRVSVEGTSLVLTLPTSGDRLTVEGFLAGDDPFGSANPLQQVRFEDGSNWDIAKLLSFLHTGGANADSLRGTVAADRLAGMAGNDRLQGLEGDDQLDGGTGLDTAVYALARNQAQLQYKEGAWMVTAGAEGKDRLSGIERIAFPDGAVALDFDGGLGAVLKTLGAVFGSASASNERFVGIGLALADQGMSLSQLMGYALRERLGANPSHVAVVDLLYSNVVGQAPTEVERAYFVGLLDSKAQTIDGLALLAAEHSLNLANLHWTELQLSGVNFQPYIAP